MPDLDKLSTHSIFDLMNSKLDESLIYAAKRALDKVTTITKGEFTLDLSNLEDIVGVPDREILEEQILGNIKNSQSKTAYLQRLKGLFPHIYQLNEKLLEVKYAEEESLNDLMANVGYLVDFKEQGPNHFYFGENYEKWNGEDTEQRMMSEYLNGGSGTRFSSEAQMYFYYNRGQHPTRDQKPDGDLISLLEWEYTHHTRRIASLTNLLNASETIQEAEEKGISFEFDETLIFKSKMALEKITEYKDGKALFKKSGLDEHYPVPNPVEVGEQIQANLSIHKRPQEYIAELKDRFLNLKSLLKGLVEEKYLEEYSIQELDKVFWMVDRDTSKFGDSKHSYFGKKYYSTFQDEYDIVGLAVSYFYHEKNIQPTQEQIKPGDLIWRLNSAYARSEENLRNILFFISLAETIQDTVQQAEESLQQPAAEAIETDLVGKIKKPDLRVQMLIIHYLNKMECMNPKFHDVKKVARIFEFLLGKNEQNIRTHLGYTQPLFLEEDLELLLPLFKSLGSIADDVVVNMEKNLRLAEQNPNNKRKRLKPLEP